MLDYKYTEPSTKIQASDQRVQGNNSPVIHSNVSRESYFFELFDLPLDPWYGK